ncbi:MAG: hypothetical protein J7501_00265 [Bdellovibrio sp.]|nr:hypothetical protein [Bdellovibrio sp.]
MNKILLVYEDYADLMGVEATLKKVGFDVVSLTSEYSVSEQMLAFNPDVVIGSGRGGKVSSLGVGKRLKEMVRWAGKAVLIFPANFKPAPQDLIKIRVDMILEAPVAPIRIVQVLAKLLGHDESVLLERLNKAMHVESPQKPIAAAAGSGMKFNTENEAILVKGNLGEEAKAPGVGFSLEPESQEAQGESAGFDLNTEEQRETPRFKFGEKIVAADREESVGGQIDEAFPDVDLKSLERELLGGGAPEVEKVEVGGEVTEVEEALSQAQEQLAKANEGLSERLKKYAELVADVKVAPKSTVTRVEARRRQVALEADWDKENINKLDELRREFTKALFKK